MPMYEILPLIQNMYLTAKDSWEQARIVAWAAVAPHQKHPGKPSDFMEFPWEKEPTPEITPVSREELDDTAKFITQQLNNGKIKG